MIWALLAMWLLGSGPAATFLTEIKRIEKSTPEKLFIQDLEKIEKAYQEENKQFVEKLVPLLKSRLIDREAIEMLIGERTMAVQKKENMLLDLFIGLRTQITKEEWGNLYVQ